MNEYEITFKLNDTEKIVIELEESLEVVHCCYSAIIAFFHEGQKKLIGNDSIDYNLTVFSKRLAKALDNNLRLHESIREDIGYLYNQCQESFYKQEKQHRPGLVYEKVEGIDFERWVGERYDLWGHGSLAVWLYNNSYGEIIFEITPIYPGGFGDPRKRKKEIPYAQWLKNYQPYLTIKIPNDTARDWLAQTNKILNQIVENIKKQEKIHSE